MVTIRRDIRKKYKYFTIVFLALLLGTMYFAFLGEISLTSRNIQFLNNSNTDFRVKNAFNYDLDWNKIISRENNTYAAGIAMDTNKNIYLAATSNWGMGSYCDFLLYKYAPDGTLLWNRTWGLPYEGEVCYGLTLDTSNNIYLIGQTFPKFCTQLVKYDSNGNQIWNRTWEVFSHNMGLAITYANGYLWFTGYFEKALNDDDLMLVKYATNGTQIWTKTWGRSMYDRGFGISTFGDSIYICGITCDNVIHDDAFILKYDTSGNKIWNITWGGNYNEECNDIEIASTGYGYIGGSTDGFTLDSTDALLIKFDSAGVFHWIRIRNDIEADSITGITIDNGNNNIFTCGQTMNNDNGLGDLLVSKWDYNGSQPWYITWGGSSEEIGTDLVVDNEENTYVCGRTQSFGGSNWKVFLVKFTPVSDESAIPVFEFPAVLFLLTILCIVYIIIRSKIQNIKI